MHDDDLATVMPAHDSIPPTPRTPTGQADQHQIIGWRACAHRHARQAPSGGPAPASGTPAPHPTTVRGAGQRLEQHCFALALALALAQRAQPPSPTTRCPAALQCPVPHAQSAPGYQTSTGQQSRGCGGERAGEQRVQLVWQRAPHDCLLPSSTTCCKGGEPRRKGARRAAWRLAMCLSLLAP
jgi:hypothetical protein